MNKIDVYEWGDKNNLSRREVNRIIKTQKVDVGTVNRKMFAQVEDLDKAFDKHVFDERKKEHKEKVTERKARRMRNSVRLYKMIEREKGESDQDFEEKFNKLI